MDYIQEFYSPLKIICVTLSNMAQEFVFSFCCMQVIAHYMNLLSVMEPIVIRRQMLMQQFTMLKFFLSGLATSKRVLLMTKHFKLRWMISCYHRSFFYLLTLTGPLYTEWQ